MPQIKAEKKLLPVKVGKTHHNIASTVYSKLVSGEFREFQINITGGEE